MSKETFCGIITEMLCKRKYTDDQIFAQASQKFPGMSRSYVSAARGQINKGLRAAALMKDKLPLLRLVEHDGKIIPITDRQKIERKPRAPKYTPETDPLNTVAGIKVAAKKKAEPVAKPAPVAAPKKPEPKPSTKKPGLPATKIAKGKVAKKLK